MAYEQKHALQLCRLQACWEVLLVYFGRTHAPVGSFAVLGRAQWLQAGLGRFLCSDGYSVLRWQCCGVRRSAESLRRPNLRAGKPSLLPRSVGGGKSDDQSRWKEGLGRETPCLSGRAGKSQPRGCGHGGKNVWRPSGRGRRPRRPTGVLHSSRAF